MVGISAIGAAAAGHAAAAAGHAATRGSRHLAWAREVPAMLMQATLVSDEGQVLSWVLDGDTGPYPDTYSGHMVAEGSPACEDAATRMRGTIYIARLVWSTGDVVMVWAHDGGDGAARHAWEFWPEGAHPDPENRVDVKYGHTSRDDNRGVIHAAIMFGVSILNPTSTPDEQADDPNAAPIFP